MNRLAIMRVPGSQPSAPTTLSNLLERAAVSMDMVPDEIQGDWSQKTAMIGSFLRHLAQVSEAWKRLEQRNRIEVLEVVRHQTEWPTRVLSQGGSRCLGTSHTHPEQFRASLEESLRR